jgi:hypothetical protein
MDKKTKIYAIISTLLFFLIYFGYKHFQEESTNNSIIGKWESKEKGKENFTFKFDENKVVEINNGEETLKMNYKIDKETLRLLKDTSNLKVYYYKIVGESLSLSEKGDTLIFYKLK